MASKIVISHSSQDEIWIKIFIDFLMLTTEIKKDEIYCTTIDGTIPTGTNFKEHIKQNIEGSELVLFIFSENYFNSYFCLAELGAAWMINKNIYPIIIPPLDHSVLASTPLQDPQWTQLNSERDLMKLVDEFVNKGISKNLIPFATIDDRCREYFPKLKEAESQINSREVTTISMEQHEELLKEHEKANEALKKMQDEIRILEKMNEDLKKATSKEEIKEVEKEYSTEWGYFENLTDEAKNKLNRLDTIVKSAIFYDLRGDVFYPERNSSEHSEAVRLEKRGRLNIDDQGEGIQLNHEYPDINEASDKIQELDSFIKSKGDILEEPFREEYGIPLNLKAADFWEEVFGVQVADIDV